MFLVTNVRSLQSEAKSSCSETLLVKPNLFADNSQATISENESSKTKVQKQPHRESKLKAKTAMSKPEDNFSSGSETEDESNATKENQENLEKEPIKLGPQKYGCPFCSKIMPIPAQMKAHILIHTGDQPFKCDVCGKAFNRKVNLKRHTMIHTGEKPFSCSKCEKRFVQKAHLQLHLKNYHAKQ